MRGRDVIDLFLKSNLQGGERQLWGVAASGGGGVGGRQEAEQDALRFGTRTV